MLRRSFFQNGILAAFGLTVGLIAPAYADEAKKSDKAEEAKAPKVEVVFVLDTTGSMGGLLEGAKQKIWAICNQIVSGKPTPDLKVGLVAFKDRGDEYVTKVTDLTDDLDAIHKELKTFKAAGGGDIPESVNEALHVAVTKVKWSKDEDTLRILFLVGDAPPHMDYADDVKYPETCKKACEMGIIINTIQCGGDANCTKFWKDIAGKSEGAFVAIAQDGGVVAVATPFDKRLAEINGELAGSTVAFGRAEQQRATKDAAVEAKALAPAAAADRAGFAAKKESNGANDLLDALKAKKVKLEDLKKDELPEELQKMDVKEQKEYLEKLDKKRTDLQKEALELDKKRTEHIAKELEKTKGKSGFDAQVLEILRKQAKKVKIEY
jgi:Mg-chelatase subunit ChlD